MLAATVVELRKLLAEYDETVPLDLAGLQIAEVEFPGLDPAPYLELLESHARELGEMTRDAAGPDFVKAAVNYLFDSLGFHGNEKSYYEAQNSCLNQVLLRRTGIPITLSLVLLEIGRRLRRPVAGIGLPGHFLVRYEEGSYTTWIDCFRGREVGFEECRDLALQTSRIDILSVPSALAPVTKRQLALRMLYNLRNVYFQNRDWARAIWILDRLIEAAPESSLERKQRGVLRLDAGDPGGALEDFRVYLALAPAADPDRDTIAAQAAKLVR